MAKSKKSETPNAADLDVTAEQDGKHGETIAAPPETSLLSNDVVMRGAAFFARRAAEKAFLGSRLTQRLAKEAIEDRSAVNAVAAYGITRLATRSVPGAILVGGGLVAKALFDRSEKRRVRLAKEAEKEAKRATKAAAKKSKL